MSTADREVREFWIHPDYDKKSWEFIALANKPIHNDFYIHVIERKAYDSLKAENEQLKQELEEVKAKYDELKSYLPKVPTQAYEKELAKENEWLKRQMLSLNKELDGRTEENYRLKQGLAEFNSDAKDGE